MAKTKQTGKGQPRVHTFFQSNRGQATPTSTPTARSSSDPNRATHTAGTSRRGPQTSSQVNPISPTTQEVELAQSEHSRVSGLTNSQSSSVNSSVSFDLDSTTSSPSKKNKKKRKDKRRSQSSPSKPKSPPRLDPDTSGDHPHMPPPRLPGRENTKPSGGPQGSPSATTQPSGNSPTPPRPNPKKRAAQSNQMETESTPETPASPLRNSPAENHPSLEPARTPGPEAPAESTKEATQEADEDLPSRLQVDPKKAPTRVWMRVCSKIKISQYEGLSTRAFQAERVDSDLPGIRTLLAQTRLKENIDKGTLIQVEYDTLMNDAVAHTFAPNNVFYHEDAEKKGLPSKSAFLAFTVRLAATPVEALPSWDPSVKSLVHPNFWERLWYAAYLKYGSVKSTSNQLARDVANKQTDSQTNQSIPPGTPTPGSSSKTGPATQPSRKGRSYPSTRRRKPHDSQRKSKTFFWVQGPVSPPYTKPDQGSELQGSYFCELLHELRQASPDCIIALNSTAKNANQRKPITPAMDQSEWPSTKYDVDKYTQHFWFSKAGRPMEFVVALQHDETPEQLMEAFHERREEHGFSLSIHAIQQWNTSTVCWLLGSNQHCDLLALAEAIMNHTTWQSNFPDQPQAKIYCMYQIIKTDPAEFITDWANRVQAVHLICRHQDRHKVLSVVSKIYNLKARRNFPLHRKYQVYANAGDRSMAVGAAMIPTVKAARKAQQKYVNSLRFRVLEGAIEDPTQPVFGQGPPLTAMMAGLTHPDFNKPLIASFDRTSPESQDFTVAFPASNAALVQELLDRLYIYWKDKYGDSAGAPFFTEYIQSQEAAFSITGFGIVSTADRLLAEMDTGLNEWEGLEEGSDQEEEEQMEEMPLVQNIQHIRMRIPMAYSTHTLVKLRDDAISESTRRSLRVDAVSEVDQKSIAFAEWARDMDIPQVIASLPFKTVWDIPGFPPKRPPSDNPIKDPKGARMYELHRLLYDLDQSIEVPAPDADFLDLYHQWDDQHGGKDYNYSTYSQAKQYHMLLGMCKKEHISSSLFFHRYALCSFDRILELHSQRRLIQAYPQPTYFGAPKTDPVVALPVFKASAADRQTFYYWMNHHPNKDSLTTLLGRQRLHLFGLACFQLFYIKEQDCPKSTFAKLFGLTITAADIVDLQATYLHELQTLTANFRRAWEVTLPDDQSDMSMGLHDDDGYWDPPLDIIQEAPASSPPAPNRLSSTTGTTEEPFPEDARPRSVSFRVAKAAVRQAAASDSDEDAEMAIDPEESGPPPADQDMKETPQEPASQPHYCAYTIRPHLLHLEETCEHLQEVPALPLLAQFDKYFQPWYLATTKSTEPAPEMHCMKRVMFRECVMHTLQGKESPTKDDFENYFKDLQDIPYRQWTFRQEHWPPTPVLFEDAPNGLLISPRPRGTPLSQSLLSHLTEHPFTKDRDLLLQEVLADLFYTAFPDNPEQSLCKWLDTGNWDHLHPIMADLDPNNSSPSREVLGEVAQA